MRLGEIGRDQVRLGEMAVRHSACVTRSDRTETHLLTLTPTLTLTLTLACVTSSDRTETDMENLTPGAPVRQLDWGETTAHMKKRPRPCIMSMTLGLGLGLR